MVTTSVEQQRDPSIWGISWRGRLHRLAEPVKVDDKHRMYATSLCGSSVYLFGWLTGRSRHPAIRRLLMTFSERSAPECQLCARSGS